MSNEILAWLKNEGLFQKAVDSKPCINKVFKESLKIKNEKVLIITDRGSANKRVAPIIGAAYYMAAKDLGLDTLLIAQSVKTSGDLADPWVDKALVTLKKKSIVIMPVSNKLGETKLVGKSFRGFMRKRGHRFVTAPSLGAVETNMLRYFIDSMDINYDLLHKKQMKVKKLFDNAKEFHVTSPEGSDFFLNVKGVTSISNDGYYSSPGAGGNLPTGEVYLPPAKNGVNGSVMIDLCSRNRHGTILLKKPIKLEVEKSSVTEITGEKGAKLLDQSLSIAEEKAKYPKRVRKVGEFGVGFNPNARIIGAMIVDEKVMGTAHIAIGSNYWFGGDIRTIVHYDQVFSKPTVSIDGKEFEYEPDDG